MSSRCLAWRIVGKAGRREILVVGTPGGCFLEGSAEDTTRSCCSVPCATNKGQMGSVWRRGVLRACFAVCFSDFPPGFAVRVCCWVLSRTRLNFDSIAGKQERTLQQNPRGRGESQKGSERRHSAWTGEAALSREGWAICPGWEPPFVSEVGGRGGQGRVRVR